MTLPEDAIVANKQYTVTWMFHVGTEVDSGTEIPFVVGAQGTGWHEDVVVTVK